MADNSAYSNAWVLPSDVKAYSDLKTVQERSDEKLITDISRAMATIISYTHNKFEEYDAIPQPVRTATILLAERYAHNAVEKTVAKQSETFDDYSYTAKDTTIDVDDLDIAPLLSEFVIPVASGKAIFRMRKI